MAWGNQGPDQALSFRARCTEAKVGHRAGRVDRQQHAKVLLPAQPMIPTDIGDTSGTQLAENGHGHDSARISEGPHLDLGAD